MTIIADEIQVAFNHSPKHKDALAGAVRDVEPWDVHAYATILGTKCRELGITDFPNPYKPVKIEDEDDEKTGEAKNVHNDKRHVWATIFDACYLNVGIDPADPVYSIVFQPAPPVEDDDGPGNEIDMPDFENMPKADIINGIDEFYGVQLPKSWSHAKLVAAAEEIILTAEEADPAEDL